MGLSLLGDYGRIICLFPFGDQQKPFGNANMAGWKIPMF